MLTHVHKVTHLVVGTFEHEWRSWWSEGDDCHCEIVIGHRSRSDRTQGSCVRSIIHEGGANNDGGACVRDEDDLEDMIRALGPEILLKSPKGLKNLERMTKASKEMCMVLKRAIRHIGYCYILCLSYSSWRLSTAGSTAVSMIYCVSCHGCCHNQTQFPPIRTKRRRS